MAIPLLLALGVALAMPAQALEKAHKKQPPVRLRGALTESLVQEALGGQDARFRACYLREFGESHRHPRGRLRIRFGVDQHGRVTIADVTESSFRREAFEDCARNVVLNTVFPDGLGESEVDTTLAFPSHRAQR